MGVQENIATKVTHAVGRYAGSQDGVVRVRNRRKVGIPIVQCVTQINVRMRGVTAITKPHPLVGLGRSYVMDITNLVMGVWGRTIAAAGMTRRRNVGLLGMTVAWATVATVVRATSATVHWCG